MVECRTLHLPTMSRSGRFEGRSSRYHRFCASTWCNRRPPSFSLSRFLFCPQYRTVQCGRETSCNILQCSMCTTHPCIEAPYSVYQAGAATATATCHCLESESLGSIAERADRKHPLGRQAMPVTPVRQQNGRLVMFQHKLPPMTQTVQQTRGLFFVTPLRLSRSISSDLKNSYMYGS